MVGERRPDDESDRVVHRGGRFINNMYVPNPEHSGNIERLPEEVVIRAELGPNPQLTRAGRSYEDVSRMMKSSLMFLHFIDAFCSGLLQHK